ncbi:uncharacterized protein LOC136028455 [Artemia franciscana]|uniref:uncharacterized protein LOC136028455 n=1 Tax=Artemia franciscana TaxID=6661 RepID=UPI0032DB7197
MESFLVTFYSYYIRANLRSTNSLSQQLHAIDLVIFIAYPDSGQQVSELADLCSDPSFVSLFMKAKDFKTELKIKAPAVNEPTTGPSLLIRRDDLEEPKRSPSILNLDHNQLVDDFARMKHRWFPLLPWLLLRNTVDKALREEHYGLRKGRECVDQFFTLRLPIEKHLIHQTALVLSFIDYEQVFDSVDRTALVKVLSLCGIPVKYIRVISVMHENNAATVKIGNEANSWYRIKSLVRQGCVLYPFKLIILMDFVLSSTGKVTGEHGVNGEEKLF